MDKCPFCDFEIEPEDSTFKELAKHVVRNHESIFLEKLVNFLYASESPRYFIAELFNAFNDLLTERWYNS